MKQKRKVKSLVATSSNSDSRFLSGLLLVLGGLLSFGAISLLMMDAEVGAAGSTNGKYAVYTGVDDKQEVVYSISFVDRENQDDVINEVYSEGNGDNTTFYIVPNPVIVKRLNNNGNLIGSNEVTEGKYSNILGGDDEQIYSNNVTMIGGYKNVVSEGNDNAIMLGGKNWNNIGSTANNGLSPAVVIGGSYNKVSTGHRDGGVIVGGNNGTVSSEASGAIILGGESNVVSGENVIVGGKYVNVNPDLSNIFVFSNSDQQFYPESSNAFYLDLDAGLGLNMESSNKGVSSSGAVSFGDININNTSEYPCNQDSLGLEGTYNGCLYGCVKDGSNYTWKVLVNSENCNPGDENGSDIYSGYCRMSSEDFPTLENTELCPGANPGNIIGAQIDPKIFAVCPTSISPDVPSQQCIYRCKQGYTLGSDKKCHKDCTMNWSGSVSETVKYGSGVTAYKSVSCTGTTTQCASQTRRCTGTDLNNSYMNGSSDYVYKNCKLTDKTCSKNGKYIQTSVQHGSCDTSTRCTEYKAKSNPYACVQGDSWLACSCDRGYHSEPDGSYKIKCEPNRCDEASLPDYAVWVEGTPLPDNDYADAQLFGTEFAAKTVACGAICDDEHKYENGKCVPKEYHCGNLTDDMEWFGGSENNVTSEYADQVLVYMRDYASQAVNDGVKCVAICKEPDYHYEGPDDGYGGYCVENAYKCTPTDTNPENAYLYNNHNNSNWPLTENKPKKVFASDVEAGTYPCAYLCEDSYYPMKVEEEGKEAYYVCVNSDSTRQENCTWDGDQITGGEYAFGKDYFYQVKDVDGNWTPASKSWKYVDKNENSLGACEYTCSEDYKWDNTEKKCVEKAKCIGEDDMFNIATQVSGPGDNDEDKKLYPSREDAAGHNCAYVCEGEYSFIYGSEVRGTVDHCGKCKPGANKEYENGKLVGCSETIDVCAYPYYYDLQSRKCRAYGHCITRRDDIVPETSFPEHALGGYEDILPIGGQDMVEWSCVDNAGNIQGEHACTFACERGYLCRDSLGFFYCEKPYCNGDKPGHFTVTKPSKPRTSWTYIEAENETEFYSIANAKSEGCYMWCPEDRICKKGMNSPVNRTCLESADEWTEAVCNPGGSSSNQSNHSCVGFRPGKLLGETDYEYSAKEDNQPRKEYVGVGSFEEHKSEGCVEGCNDKTTEIKYTSDGKPICWRKCDSGYIFQNKNGGGCKACSKEWQIPNPDTSSWQYGNPVDCVNKCNQGDIYCRGCNNAPNAYDKDCIPDTIDPNQCPDGTVPRYNGITIDCIDYNV